MKYTVKVYKKNGAAIDRSGKTQPMSRQAAEDSATWWRAQGYSVKVEEAKS